VGYNDDNIHKNIYYITLDTRQKMVHVAYEFRSNTF